MKKIFPAILMALLFFLPGCGHNEEGSQVTTEVSVTILQLEYTELIPRLQKEYVAQIRKAEGAKTSGDGKLVVIGSLTDVETSCVAGAEKAREAVLSATYDNEGTIVRLYSMDEEVHVTVTASVEGRTVVQHFYRVSPVD